MKMFSFSLKLTIIFRIKLLILDFYESGLVWTAAELADMSHEIIHARWTAIEKVRSHFDVVVEQRQLGGKKKVSDWSL